MSSLTVQAFIGYTVRAVTYANIGGGDRQTPHNLKDWFSTLWNPSETQPKAINTVHFTPGILYL